MISKALREAIAARKQAFTDNTLQSRVPVGGALHWLAVRSKQQIMMPRITWDRAPEGAGAVTHDAAPQPRRVETGAAADWTRHLSTYNAARSYHWRVEFETPVHMEALQVHSDVQHLHCDWIFGAEFEVGVAGADGAVVSRTSGFDDGIDWPSAKTGSDPSVFNLLRDAAHRASFGRSFWYYSHFRKTMSAARFGEIEGLLRDVLGPSTLGQHGYRRSLGGSDRAALATGLRQAMDKLAEHGIETFVASGTLLGAVRHGGFLLHDDDADLGVLLPGETMAQVYDSLERVAGVLRDQGLLLWDRLGDSGEPTRWKLRSVAGVSIDLFPCWLADGRVHAYPYCFAELDAQALVPLGRVQLEGLDLPAPADPEAFLACNYGADWRVPNGAFKFDWAAAEAKFAAFSAGLRQRRGKS